MTKKIIDRTQADKKINAIMMKLNKVAKDHNIDIESDAHASEIKRYLHDELNVYLVVDAGYTILPCTSPDGLVKYAEEKHPYEEVRNIEKYLKMSATSKNLWMNFQSVIANPTILEPIGAHVYGPGLKLISPRNSYIRPGDDVHFKFEDTFTDAPYEYEISLLERDKEIFKESVRIQKGERGKKIPITCHKKLQLREGREYRWEVETKHELKRATFKVLEDGPLNFLKEMEEELNKIKDETERDFLLGALYESVRLYDDAIEKYKSLLERYNIHTRALMQLSMVYAKKLTFEKNIYPYKLSLNDVMKDIDLANEMDRWVNKIRGGSR